MVANQYPDTFEILKSPKMENHIISRLWNNGKEERKAMERKYFKYVSMIDKFCLSEYDTFSEDGSGKGKIEGVSEYIRDPSQSLLYFATDQLSSKLSSDVFSQSGDIFTVQLLKISTGNEQLDEEINESMKGVSKEKNMDDIVRAIAQYAQNIYKDDTNIITSDTSGSKIGVYTDSIYKAFVLGNRIQLYDNDANPTSIQWKDAVINKHSNGTLNYIIIRKEENLALMTKKELQRAGYEDSEIAKIRENKIDPNKLSVFSYTIHKKEYVDLNETKYDKNAFEEFAPNEDGEYFLWKQCTIINGREVNVSYTQVPYFWIYEPQQTNDNYSPPLVAKRFSTALRI